ncbi:glycosylphosphatidylinositol anchored membrane protein boudin [Rhynchophorus ferrugineus]|uniref:glycosylphosphatidylinositol anchored membrane protein boudin n=1 Tax=Rhynchophorus ferrugineus TaxID=354439 RepID=UPI003FCE1D49
MYTKCILMVAVIISLCDVSFGLDCYQCNGANSLEPFQCNEWLSSDIDIKPEPCDEVYGAKYCIKHTGRFEGVSIKCYQCSSTDNLGCSDSIINSDEVYPESCDHIYDAQYCVKSTGLGGGIGTKRYCSSLDLGNYCNYVKQPGDTLTYRSCVHTCTGDGCNAATSNTYSHLFIFCVTLISTFLALSV